MGVRHRHRLPGLGRRALRVAHQPHDQGLRPERSGAAALHPRLRAARAGAGLDRDRAGGRARAHRVPQPRLLRVRHRGQGGAADRRPRQAARGKPAGRGPVRAHAREPALSPDRPARHVAGLGRAHRLPDPGHLGAPLVPGRAGSHARLRAPGLGVAPQRVSGGPPARVHGGRHHRAHPVLGRHLRGARSHRGLLPPRRPLRPALEQRVVQPRLLRPARVHRVLQRGGAGGGRARPVPPDRGRLLCSVGHREDGQALRRGVGRAPLQDRDPDQQRGRGRSRLRLPGGPGRYRAPHRGADRAGPRHRQLLPVAQS